MMNDDPTTTTTSRSLRPSEKATALLDGVKAVEVPAPPPATPPSTSSQRERNRRRRSLKFLDEHQQQQSYHAPDSPGHQRGADDTSRFAPSSSPVNISSNINTSNMTTEAVAATLQFPLAKSAAPTVGISSSTHATSIHSSSAAVVGAPPSSANRRLYRASSASASTGGGVDGSNIKSKFVTRDIAALEFLLGIPLAAEASLVQTGWRLQQKQYEEEDHDEDYSEPDFVSGNYAASNNSNVDSHHQHHISATKKYASGYATATSHGTWWEKHVRSFNDHADTPSHTKSKQQQQQQQEGGELERPTTSWSSAITKATRTASGILIPAYTPGRRLDGDEAILVQIPLTTDDTKTRQRSIARVAALREWERKTAHGIVSTTTNSRQQQQQQQPQIKQQAPLTPISDNHGLSNMPQLRVPNQPPLLDGRLFFSASGSYPVSVFSMIRYEPRREQAEQIRKKLESLGGGGSQFIMPTRDWRGISYRVLLPRKKILLEKNGRKNSSLVVFNRFLRPTTTPTTAALLVPSSSTGTAAAAAGGSGDAEQVRKLGIATGQLPDSAGDDNKSRNKDNDSEDDNQSTSSDSSEDSDVYVPGLLDDPDMSHGRHHNVMMGDHVTGPIVSSTIQFVKPAILKAELNKQFRDRFDGWEPPKSARKYIGAYVSVPEGKYVLNDPTTSTDDNAEYSGRPPTRIRQGSTTSMSSASEGGHKDKTSTLRIPPSLTLSKIRSLKQQALHAAVKAKLEVGTVALACVYFERLCMDCRVDKSNRRLAFAACLLLATKINEPNVRLIMQQQQQQDDVNNAEKSRFQSLARVTKRSTKAFASLLEFFTEKWSLSVKMLFDAEWGVFAALGFSLHATPSQVAFHFRRLLKTLEWNPRDYLGKEMWEQWQNALKEEERRKRERERRRDIERKKKEEKLLDLQLELEHEVLRRQAVDKTVEDKEPLREEARRQHQQSAVSSNKDRGRMTVGIKLFNPFGMRRSHSVERLGRLVSASDHPIASTQRSPTPISGFPSMPALSHHDENGIAGVVSIEIPEGGGSETSSIGAVEGGEVDGLIV